MGGDQAAAKTLFGRSSLDGGTADAPRFTAVVVASFAAGAGVGLLASGGPRGSTAATIAFATVVALAAVWSAVANAREAQASVGRDLVAAVASRPPAVGGLVVTPLEPGRNRGGPARPAPGPSVQSGELVRTGASSTVVLAIVGLALVDLGWLMRSAVPAHLRRRGRRTASGPAGCAIG